ncbi:MAG: response regulator receiver protein, partial [Cyanobacteria bacterium J06648_11]
MSDPNSPKDPDLSLDEDEILVLDDLDDDDVISLASARDAESDGAASAPLAEEATSSAANTPPSWKVLVVDDEEQVHAVTRLALKNFAFEERPLEIISAYSKAEAQKVIDVNPDTAVLLLDVVMESDRAGLELVQYIRESLKNLFVRIILRTGQPGAAPESTVIEGFDINDYKAKTELTQQKLVSTMIT